MLRGALIHNISVNPETYTFVMYLFIIFMHVISTNSYKITVTYSLCLQTTISST